MLFYIKFCENLCYMGILFFDTYACKKVAFLGIRQENFVKTASKIEGG